MIRRRRWPAIAATAITLVFAMPAPAGAITGAPACPLLPSDNVWHADVSALAVNAKSGQYVASMGSGGSVHADFGSGKWAGGPIGIPFTTVGSGQKKVSVSFKWPNES